ncbi:MAG: DoxX family protein [Phycisphaerales bacterium]|nr:DoxX family protein [Phycisphaerales bacterium]
MNSIATNMPASRPTLISTIAPRCGTLSMPAKIGAWVLQVSAAVILGQTLFFKFTAAPEPVYIFTKLGAEPWGRIGSGVAELITVVLLLTPRTAVLGAILALGTMAGAIASHLGPLGIVITVNGESDGGTLFGLALGVTVAAIGVLVLRRSQLFATISGVRAMLLNRPAH